MTSYDYYDTAINQGEVKSVTGTWSTGGAPASQVTTYTYAGPADALLNQYPATTVTTIGGNTAAQTAATYDFTTSSPEGKPLVRQTALASANGSVSQQTVTVSYAPDTDYVFSERPYAIKLPSGAQQSFRYEEGSYSGGEFTPGSGGNAWLTTIVSGSATGGGSQVSSVTDPATSSSLVIEPIYLVANKSTLTQIIRDAQEDVLSQTTYVYNGSGFDTAHPIASTVNTWLDSARQSQSVALNGAMSTWTWSGAYLQSQTGPTGIETDYTYDSAGRIATQTKTAAVATGGLPAQAAKVTTYAYDAANRIVSATESSGSLSRATTYTYDAAGRITSVLLPDGRHSTDAYVLSGGDLQVTETLPCGGTIVTTTLPDGKTLSVTG
ncbi:MAG: hypothetical protein ACRDNS_34525, partial [Trebonia sp.]